MGLINGVYETPHHLAQKLVQHVPGEISRILDPAVGGGALLKPLLKRLEQEESELVCVDIEQCAIDRLQENLKGRRIRSKFINQDFLAWGIAQEPNSFDCVLMNPPFGASRSDCHSVSFMQSEFEHEKRLAPVPLEAAFVCVAHRLLATDGRLLTILPSSVIMSESLHWMRSFLLSKGSIEYVYEFPTRTFKSVDSKIYLLIYKKGAPSQNVSLIGSGSSTSQHIFLKESRDITHRLDYNFYYSRSCQQKLISKSKLNWTPLGNVATILRGSSRSIPRPSGIVHSTDFSNGRWKPPLVASTTTGLAASVCIGFRDLIMRRVGRNNHRTLGDAHLVQGLMASDCLLLIRPHDDIGHLDLLFALKVLMKIPWVSSLLERGTGARYICKSSLEQLVVPINARLKFSGCYRHFVNSLLENSTKEMNTAVSDATATLLRTTDTRPIVQQTTFLKTNGFHEGISSASSGN